MEVAARGATAVLSVALIAFAFGCGSNAEPTTGSSAQSQQVWANSVCNAFLSWESSVKSIGQGLKGQARSKSAIQQAAREVQGASTTLRTTVKSLGKPPTPAAAQAKSIIQTLANELQSAGAAVNDALSKASGAKGVGQAASVAQQQVTKAFSDVSAAVTQLQSLNAQGTWKKAFSSAQSCQALSKS